MNRRVLVTRPEPGASATAARLGELGFEPVLLPLTRIVALPPETLPDTQAVDCVVVTSANALRHAPGALLSSLAGKPVFAVGDATAQAALDAGLGDVRSASGTARDLVALLGARLPRRARILHLAGRERTEGFAEAIVGDGHELQTLELYTAEKISYSTDFFQHFLAGGPIWGALVMSSRAGELLAELASVPENSQSLDKTIFFCISEKASLPLRAVAGASIRVSDDPTEDGILRLVLSQA